MYSKMKKKLLLLFPLLSLAILTVSCGEQVKNPVPSIAEGIDGHVVEKDFILYFNKVAKDIGQPITQRVTIRYMTKEETEKYTGSLGVCLSEIRTVLIKKEQWDKLNVWNRWTLIAHELGHCAYNIKEHRKENREVMSTYSFEIHNANEYQRIMNNFKEDVKKATNYGGDKQQE